MIFVNMRGVKSEDRGAAGGNRWYDTEDVAEAIARALADHDATWSALGYGALVGYEITVATEASPRRTIGARAGKPLPVNPEGER